LPQVIELCNSLLDEAPVVIYCLDNSSFWCGHSDGQLSAIFKQKDGLYHVPGEIVVVHEVTLALHSSPDSGFGPQADARSGAPLQQFISRRLTASANCTVTPACDLLSGKKNTSPEEALSAFSSLGAVHGTNANYTRMALTLVDTHFPQSTATAPVQPAPPTQAAKRPRAESTSSYQSGSESGLLIPALSSFRAPRFKAPAGRQPPLPVFTRGRTRGGSNRSSKRGFQGGRGTAGRSGH
jgi:hypothetical protein